MHAKRGITTTTAPVQYDPQVHEPEWSVADLERHRIMQEIRESPAFLTILRYGEFARDFGMDTTDPAVMRRVVEAALKGHARDIAHEEHRASYRALKNPDRRGLEHSTVVYYMLMSGLVKIGITKNIRRRFNSLHPERVLAVEPGGTALEEQRHAEFADLHSHGEWFRLGDRLQRHIDDVREQFAAETGKSTEQWLRSVGMPIPK